ncbi:hypothetical protein [Streptomyces sp. NPDC001389]|uniref:hypothetical protein n=1 Tax=unclassified Streptomyces TaxID=2593676 RepID=UPI00367D9F27
MTRGGPSALDGDLTVDPKTVGIRVEQNTATRPGEDPSVVWDDSTGTLTVTARPNTYFQAAGSMALVPDGFPVSATPGLVLPHVTERAASGVLAQKYPVTLSLPTVAADGADLDGVNTKWVQGRSSRIG